MSNQQESLLKETKDLLETAQKEVLKEINNKRSWLSRIFNKEEADSLKHAQSSISKAINQMKNFVKDEASLIVKLQNHLNEKNSAIKKLEEDFTSSQKETSNLRDKIKFFEQEFERLKQERLDSAIEPSEAKAPKDNKFEEELKSKIKSLEEMNRDIQQKYNVTQEALNETQMLAVELSMRIKRLKSEIVSTN